MSGEAFARERRRSPRSAALTEAGAVLVRIRGAGEVQVVNMSRGGALVHAPVRLLPGRRCVVQWTGPRGTRTVLAEVVRSELVGVDARARPVYRAAVVFEQEIDETWGVATHQGTDYPS
jgi:hypothetical protein